MDPEARRAARHAWRAGTSIRHISTSVVMRGVPDTGHAVLRRPIVAAGSSSGRGVCRDAQWHRESRRARRSADRSLAARAKSRSRPRRAIFTEAVRGFGRCSTCHEVNDRGVSVAAPIAKIPASATDLRLSRHPT